MHHVVCDSKFKCSICKINFKLIKSAITTQIFETLQPFICPLFIFRKKIVNTDKNSSSVYKLDGNNSGIKCKIGAQCLHTVYT